MSSICKTTIKVDIYVNCHTRAHCDTNTTISAGVVHDGWFEVSARFHRYLDKSRGAAMHTMPGWDIQVRIRTTGLCAL